MTIWERVNAALTGLGVPMAANRYISATGTDLPDLFMTYFLVSNPVEQFADNSAKAVSYRVQVSVYNRAGLISLPDVTGSMVAAGFMRAPVIEIPYNQDTRHYGLALEFTYLEKV